MGKRGVWYWQSDSGWLRYESKIQLALERGLKTNETRVRVDTERFVDLKNLLQRRYDDESKRRPVKREEEDDVPPEETIFSEDIFCVVAASEKKVSKISSDIAKHGGLVALRPHPKVTVIVCPTADASGASQIAALKSASSLAPHAPRVTPEFIVDSIAEQTRVDPYKYLLASSSVPAAHSAGPSLPSTSPSASAADPFQVGSEWQGMVLTPYAFDLHVEAVSAGGMWSGKIVWPELGTNGCTTKVEGSANGPREVVFTETDCLVGEDVELPNHYTGYLDDTTGIMKGTFTDNLKQSGRFELSVLKVS